MTEQESLIKSLKLWEYLQEHPEEGKEQAYLELGFSNDLYNCPFCEYVLENFRVEWYYEDTYWEMDCNQCPVINEWHSYADFPEFSYKSQTRPCLENKTPFNDWMYEDETGEGAAKKMVELIKRAMELKMIPLKDTSVDSSNE